MMAELRDLVGRCDACPAEYDTADIYDHCAECGNCWTHCPDIEEHTYCTVKWFDGAQWQLDDLREAAYERSRSGTSV